MKDSPLIVQSDRTLLLDVHHPLFEECRNDISTFCDLIKSPEHIHTYALTPISLWNAASCGIVSTTVLEKLNEWSKFPLTASIKFFIEDISSRFGKLVLCEDDRDGKKAVSNYTTDRTNDEIDKELNEYLKQKALNSKIKRDLSKKKREGVKLSEEEQKLLDSLIVHTTIKTEEDKKNNNLLAFEEVYLLKISDSLIFRIIDSNRELKSFLYKVSDGVFALRKLDRGEIKVKLIELGYPVDDRIPLKKGVPIDVKLRKTTLAGKPFEIRDYQETAAQTLVGGAAEGSGYGTIVLPCGSGKTIIGIDILTKLATRTLVITTNVASVHQWVNEIKDKTTLTGDDIGQYTGENKSAKKVTVCTYQVLTWRPDKIGPFPHFELLTKGEWGLIIYDEVHMLPAPVFKVTAELQSLHRVGLTATLVREDNKEDQVFSLVGPKRYDVPWSELEQRGYIAEAFCSEIRIPLPLDLEVPYALAKPREQFKIASENPRKLEIVHTLLKKHEGEFILIIGQYLSQLKIVSKELNTPIITGATSNKKRDELYSKFRRGDLKVLVVSKVANFAIDLPDASVAIQLSGTFGSRAEEAQRLGRILRPKKISSHFYSLVTQNSSEEEFALNRQKFLAEQGYKYSIEIYDKE
ncbi:MAG: helicase-associated domain-containing protein [Sphaerochaetaceae bacterium]|nr:helicase-associated domain-containing protein [Sphaerochaetaceae bacterium]MDC7248397.1 helicase-associated domain-containing protein [Sphaerochaetaceae bacterium]